MTAPDMRTRPTFDLAVEETLSESLAICAQRGGEYLDTWDLDNLIATFTDATLKAMGVKLNAEQLRLVMCAALVDVKDSRMIGPFKADTVVDGINYRAAYASLRAKYDAGERDRVAKALAIAAPHELEDVQASLGANSAPGLPIPLGESYVNQAKVEEPIAFGSIEHVLAKQGSNCRSGEC